ncbi:MAG: MATE family efflux transporter [Moraxellaceae bacterium]|nr:MAG: MATE family efflux transporter [Moraxellaceae bacterium]
MSNSSKDASRIALLTQAPVASTLRKMTTPMILGIMAILLFNLVDIFFIGLMGPKELAAISFTFPVSFILMNIAMGVGIGTATMLSANIGGGDKRTAKRFGTHALLLAAALAIPLSLIGILTLSPVFRLLGADDSTLPLITDYMNIWFSGLLFLYIPMIGNSTIRATGDTKTPSIIMALAGLANGIMDPILIFGLGPIPALGIKGAAIATILSWIVASIAVIYLLSKHKRMITLQGFGFTQLSSTLPSIIQDWYSILRIGIPATATNLLGPIALGIFTRLVSTHGEAVVAGYGVGTRIESLAMVVFMALSSAITPFIGQNYGAGKQDRIKQSLKIALSFSICWGLFIALILLVAAKPIAQLFNNDSTVIEVTALFLWIVPFSYGFQGLAMLICASLNALQRPVIGMIINGVRLFFLSIPMAFIGEHFYGIKGIFVGMSVANIIAGIGALVWLITHIDALTQPPIDPAL